MTRTHFDPHLQVIFFFIPVTTSELEFKMWAMGLRRPRDNQLVKMRRESRIPVLIDNGAFGTHRLSPSHLRQNWPFLYHDLRQSGNRVLDPISRFGATFRNRRDFDIEPLVWAYFGSRLKNLEREDRYGLQSPPFRGLDPDNLLFLLYVEIEADLRRNDLNSLNDDLGTVVSIFRRLCELLSGTDHRGRSYGQGLYMEILEMARLFASMISEAAPVAMYLILESIDNMTDGDTFTLQMVIIHIAPADQQDIIDLALGEALRGSLAGDRIFQAFI